MPIYSDEFGELTDGMFETLRLAPAPGTPIRPPDRRGHPALTESPQQVAFAPSWPLRLRLEPDGRPYAYQEDGWRQKLDLPACRLVWIGDVVGSSGDREPPQVRALVRLTSESSDDRFTELTLPLTLLPLLSVGRVLKEPSDSDEPSSAKGGPSRERRFLGNEWSIDLWFGSGAESITTARELPALAIATLAAHPDFADAPLYVVTDAARRRLVAIPCWEIFRVYYAGAPRVARLLFDFPRWKAGTLERMLRSFDGHQFFGPAKPASADRDRIGDRHAYAAGQLLAVGRETVVAYAMTGRAQIRAIPPVCGPIRLRCVGIPLAFDGCEALFVQQIVLSEPAPEAQAGIGWWSLPARPLFRSHAEAAAWWGAYRCGAVPGRPQTPTWSAFAANANRQAELAELRDLRIHGPQRLATTLERVLRALPAA